jgi:hypothetical protein|nr:MAG TPA: nucelotide kinase [Caudoviricetes sp.]
MSTKFDAFRKICDQEFGPESGQEKIDIGGLPYGYRYDFSLANLPCFITIDYKTDDLVGCVWFNGYAFARKTRCVVTDFDVLEMIRQMRIVQYGLTEFAIEPETYSTSSDYDIVGTWSAHKSNLVIDDYIRVNTHGAVCAGAGYARMPLQQIVSDSKPEQRDDAVNAPKYYSWLGGALSKQVENVSDVEVFHVLMAAFDKDPLLWQVGKYLLRAGRKDDRKQDLEKARWYLTKAIDPTE